MHDPTVLTIQVIKGIAIFVSSSYSVSFTEVTDFKMAQVHPIPGIWAFYSSTQKRSWLDATSKQEDYLTYNIFLDSIMV